MYREWALARLECEGDYIVYQTKNNTLGFSCMNNYSGLMAQPSRTGRNKGRVKKSKQGLFDIFVITGNRYAGRGISHRDIIEDVLEYSNIENAFRVWRDEDPINYAKSETELEVLYTLALLFFEQEINWGDEDWQRYTYFAPKKTMPRRIRPRDMLMGYIWQANDLGIDNVAYWQNARPTTTTFISPDRTNYGFEDYPLEFKRYFIGLLDDEYAEALMTKNGVLNEYREVANNSANNPFYGE